MPEDEPPESSELGGPDAHSRLEPSDNVAGLLVEARLAKTIRLMSSRRDPDDLVLHPLRRLVLVEYGDSLAKLLARVVSGRQWAPSPAYGLLIGKRSGAFREVVFPTIIDSIIARTLVDVIEDAVKTEPETRAFFGRTHASPHREVGDYSNWFQVWQDYTAKVASAARDENFAVVFETDVADFFITVDRAGAREAVARETRAGTELLNLLFDCLESWLPRFEYKRSTGLPIEPNDVSRIIAHLYLRSLDRQFPDTLFLKYLRYVDDTVVFLDSLANAREVQRRHFMALRALGLNPNFTKTAIVPVEEFEAARHREVNMSLNAALKARDVDEYHSLLDSWLLRDPNSTVSWDQVMRRFYSVGRQLRSEALRIRACEDAATYPTLAFHVLRYLSTWPVPQAAVDTLLTFTETDADVEARIRILTFLADGELDDRVDLDRLSSDLERFIKTDDFREGSGYARACAFYALLKYGRREHREAIMRWARSNPPGDEKLRMSLFYGLNAFKQLPDEVRDAARHIQTDDLTLLVRMVEDAASGRLSNVDQILKRCVEPRMRTSMIRATYLPLLELLCSRASLEEEARLRGTFGAWVDGLLSRQSMPVTDPVTRRWLEQWSAQIRR